MDRHQWDLHQWVRKWALHQWDSRWDHLMDHRWDHLMDHLCMDLRDIFQEDHHHHNKHRRPPECLTFRLPRVCSCQHPAILDPLRAMDPLHQCMAGTLPRVTGDRHHQDGNPKCPACSHHHLKDSGPHHHPKGTGPHRVTEGPHLPDPQVPLHTDHNDTISELLLLYSCHAKETSAVKT